MRFILILFLFLNPLSLLFFFLSIFLLLLSLQILQSIHCNIIDFLVFQLFNQNELTDYHVYDLESVAKDISDDPKSKKCLFARDNNPHNQR